MINKAKCKLCGDIIESFHPTDYVVCKCNEIALDGGLAMRCYAKDFNNLLRIDDQGNEIIPTVIDKTMPLEKPKKAELLKMLDDLIHSYDNLPPEALFTPVTQCDLQSALMIIYEIVKNDA